MKTRTRLSALLAAGVLALGVTSVAFAGGGGTTLMENQVGKALGEFKQENCEEFPLEIGAGEIGVHFILNGTSDSSGLLDASFSNPVSSVTGVANADSPANALHWFIVIDGDLDTIIESASTDATGNNLVVSHVCPGGEETAPPSFEQSFEGDTDEPTDEPSFEQSFEGDTDEPTEPNTSSIDGRGSSGPADGAWLLVVALGVLLASVVVMTPARAKSRR